jgi:hypothetical protein
MIRRGSGDSGEDPPEKQAVDDPNREAAVSAVGERIESFLDAAERAAAGIREDAQEWARRYRDESRPKADDAAAQRIQELSSLTDSLVSRAKAVARQSDELIAALDDAGRRILNTTRPGSETDPAPPPAGAVPPSPPAQPASEGTTGPSEGAHLLAAQMAVTGSTRDEIARRLREEFGIKDARAILDEIGI